ncbi:MAG: hypothetical protein HY363_05595 [Candidatus Aenigmarchaeota archaeon]|nr:hypothetical protein [Candidatus Aenigmarchaeota archaeon]
MTLSVHLHSKDSIEVIGKFLQNQNNKKSIVVCSEHPYTFFSSKLTAYGVRTDRILFVDCISKAGGQKLHHENNVVFSSHPTELKELGFALQTLSKGHQLIVLDNASSMLRHNTKEAVAHFLQLLNTNVEKPVHVFSQQHQTPPEFVDSIWTLAKTVLSESP